MGRIRIAEDVAAYMARTGMSRTRLGLLALRDHMALIGSHTKGQIGPKRLARLRDFIEAFPNGCPVKRERRQPKHIPYVPLSELGL
jgi:hypothetical protein